MAAIMRVSSTSMGSVATTATAAENTPASTAFR
jgi:hypothetical protein